MSGLTRCRRISVRRVVPIVAVNALQLNLLRWRLIESHSTGAAFLYRDFREEADMRRKNGPTVVLPSESDTYNYEYKSKKIDFYFSVSLHNVSLYSHMNRIKFMGLFNYLKDFSKSYEFRLINNYIPAHFFKVYVKGILYNVMIRDWNYQQYSPNGSRPRYYLEVVGPSADFFRFLAGASRYNMRWSLSTVEFACDLFGDELHDIYGFLKHHLYLAWRGSDLDLKYDDTNYFNNVRLTSGLGGKLYLHPVLAPDRVRVELTAKTRFLNSRGIYSFYNLLATRPEDIFKRVEFKDINLGKFERYLNRDDQKNGPPSQAQARLKEMISIWDKRGINAARDVIASYYDNFYYCLESHPFQDIFKSALRDLSFSSGIGWWENPTDGWAPAGWIKAYKKPPKSMRRRLLLGQLQNDKG